MKFFIDVDNKSQKNLEQIVIDVNIKLTAQIVYSNLGVVTQNMI